MSHKKKFNSNIILDDDGKSVQHVQAVLTGILSLDCAIGTGGYAKGRFIGLFGAESSENLEVKSESLIFVQPDTGEEAFNMINEFIKTGAFDLIVVDSVAALTPTLEIDGVSIPGQQAKMMSEQLSKLVSKVN